MKRNFDFILYGLFVFLISGCYSLKEANIQYNTEKEMYEYWPNKKQSHVLRDAEGALVTEENIDEFRQELEENNYRYPISKRHEKSNYISSSDLKLTSTYSHISEHIKDQEYDSVLSKINNLETLYPEVFKYSDGLFLKGYSYENLNIVDSARVSYSNFLKYSSSKYSARFRGYRDADNKDSLFILQRNYANQILMENKPEISQGVFKELPPRFYFSSFHPGFNMNHEDMTRGSIGFLWLGLGISNITTDFSLGIQTYHKLSEKIDINPQIFFSPNTWGMHLALPVQLYRANDNRFGLKFSPFINYTRIDSLLLDDTKYNVKQGIFGGGVKISSGYYLTQKFSLGAYYTYQINNAKNPVSLTKSNLIIWQNNVYDVSIYYNILKTFGLKSGIRNDGLVAGIYWSGWELSYDITNSEFIFIMEMY